MFRAVAWTAAAKWASQVFTWVGTIVVARLLHPYDYGLVGMGGVYLSLAALVSQVGIPDAVITLRDLSQRQIAGLNTVALLLGAALVALSCAIAFPLAAFFSAPALVGVIVVSSAIYVINAFQVVPRALLQKELHFQLLATIEAVRAVAQMAATVLFAWRGYGYWSLVYGGIVASATGTVLVLFWRRHGYAAPHPRELYRELSFSGHVTLSGIGWYVYSNADFLVAGKTLGEAPLGNYTLGWTISSAPIEKIGNLLTGVTPAFFSAVQHDKVELRRYFLRITEALSYVTVPASIGIVLVADYLVPVLLGPKWLGVVGPLRLLGIFVAFRSLTTVLPKLLTAINETRFVMWNTALAVVALPLAFLVGSRWGTTGIAMAWIVIYPPIMAPLYHRIFKRLDTGLREYFSAVLPATGASTIMALVLLLVRSTLPRPWPLAVDFAILVASGVLCYVAALYAFHRKRLGQLLRSIRSMRKEPVETTEPEVALLGGRTEQ